MAGTHTLNNHLKTFRQELLERRSGLESWKEDEHLYLDVRFRKLKRRRFFYLTYRGEWYNTYGEKIGLFIWRIYNGKSPRRLGILMTAGFEVVFVVNLHGTMIYIDGIHKGVLLHNGQYVTPDGAALIFQIQDDAVGESLVYSGKEPIAGYPKYVENKLTPTKALLVYGHSQEDRMSELVAIGFYRATRINISEIQI
jgi:hypothetical protein